MSGLVADETSTVEAQIASNESDKIIANDVKKSQTLDQSTQSNVKHSGRITWVARTDRTCRKS